MTLTDQDEPIEVLASPVCRCDWEHHASIVGWVDLFECFNDTGWICCERMTMSDQIMSPSWHHCKFNFDNFRSKTKIHQQLNPKNTFSIWNKPIRTQWEATFFGGTGVIRCAFFRFEHLEARNDGSHHNGWGEVHMLQTSYVDRGDSLVIDLMVNGL